MSLRSDVEDALIAALAPLLKPHLRTETGVLGGPAGCLDFVGHYSGELEGLQAEETDDDIRRRLSGRQPAILVATGDGDYGRRNLQGRRAYLTLDLHVLITSGMLRSQEHQRRGADLDPGLYEINEQVRSILMGNRIEIDNASKLRPSGDRVVVTRPNIAILRALYQIDVVVESTRPSVPGSPLLGVNVIGQSVEDDEDDRLDIGQVNAEAS